MKVNSVAYNGLNKSRNNVSFQAGFVFVNKKNKGDKIRKIVSDFNKEMRIDKFQRDGKLSDKVNYFLLAAGSGTKLQELTQLTGDYNKICFPFPVSKDQNMHMIDFPLNFGRLFTSKDEGYKVNEIEAKGSLFGVVDYYLKHPEDIKPTIISNGDSIYDFSEEEIEEFSNECIDKKVNIGLLGTKKPPEEAAYNCGIFVFKEKSMDKLSTVSKFIEKPPYDIAKKYALYDNQNMVNTGFIYFSKEAMQKVMDKVKQQLKEDGEVTFLKKNDIEVYNSAHAINYLLDNSQELFNKKAEDNLHVKVVENWEDVGLVNTYYRFLESLRDGIFLKNMTKDKANDLQKATKLRVGEVNGQKYLLLSKDYNSLDEVPENLKENAKNLEGIHIIV